MTLATGTRLGAYEILGPLGAGGMGEVYRARDTKLGREVAIKVLPAAFTSDAERLARFEREARLLASLNHPHIAAIYGLEEIDGVRAIAMELVEGADLAALIRRTGGPAAPGIPLAEALAYASQIVDALEAAHEKGIIHRDLKPANVKVTPDGVVTVLDFGLAKALGEEPSAEDAANSPTISAIATRAGVILGTAAYMSPEQARGKPVDRRADIWAFGCVLYEMLAGRLAFRSDTTTDTLAAVLEREPDWAALPATTPPGVRRLLGRCLQKDPKRRLRDIADARLELDEALAAPQSGATAASTGASDASGAVGLAPPSARPVWRHPLPLGLAFLALAFAGAFLWALRRAPANAPEPARVARFTITLPPRQQLAAWGRTIAISPDGWELAYAVEEDRGEPGPVGDAISLFRRRLDELQQRAIPSSEFCTLPFFSADGEWLGFLNGPGSKLMKVSLRGGAPQAIATIPGPTTVDAAWSGDDEIVYSTLTALVRMSESGRPPETLMARAQLFSEKGELFFGRPYPLSGTKALLFETQGYDPEHSAISVFSDGKRRTLLTGGALVAYLATGHILFVRQGQDPSREGWSDAFIVPFDLARLQVTGKPVPVLEGVRYGQMAVSSNGTLAYASGATGGTTQQTTWLSPDGATAPVDARQPQKGMILSPRVSPDGQRLLYSAGSSQTTSKLFVRNLATGATQIVAGAPSWWCTWTPDGRRIVYIHLNPEGTAGNLYWKASDGTGAEERLTTSTHHQQPLFVTPDGGAVVYQEESPDTGFDLWMLPLKGGDRTPRVLLQTKANERIAALLPGGHWIAYVSDQTGRDEIWVRPFPTGEGALQVTSDGGTDPAWSRDGRTLFYMNLASTRLFAAPVRLDPSPGFGVPASRDGWWNAGVPYGRNYDIGPDGRLVMVSASSTAGSEITVVVNWFEELKQKLAGRK